MKKLLFIILMFTGTIITSFASEKNYSVLLINSYHQGYKWTDDVTRGIKNVLSHNRNITLSIEYLDSKRFSTESYYTKIKTVLHHKVKYSHYDAVICADNNAFQFVIDHRDTLFKNLPIVFCGINYFSPKSIKGIQNITGVNEDADFEKNFKLIFRLHPATEKIICITDTTVTGKIVRKEILKMKNNFTKKAEIQIVDNLSMEELQLLLKKQPPNTVILYALFLKDSKGVFYEFDESVKIISQSTNLPIYGTWDFSLGSGIVGGYLTSGYYQGTTAASIVLKIAAGEKADRIPIEMTSPKKYMFDYLQLQKHGIKENELPLSNIIVRRPDSFYEKNKIFVWNIIISFSLLIMIIVALILNIIKKNNAEMSLNEARKYLYDIINSMPSLLITIGTDYKIKNSNNKVSQVTGYSSEELLEMEIQKIIPELENITPFIDKVFKTGENTQIEELKINFSGKQYILMMNLYKLSFTDKDEIAIRADDITEFYNQNIQIQKLQNLLHNVTDSVSAKLIAIDSKMNIMLWNKSSEIETAIEEKNALNKNLFHLLPRLSDYAELFHNSIENSTFKQINKLTSFTGTEPRYEEVKISPLISSEMKGAVILINDITTKIKLDEMVIQSEKMLSLGGMAAGMAHEINNPLAGIMQSAQFLKIAVSPEFEKNIITAEKLDLKLEKIQEYMNLRKMTEMINIIMDSGERAANIVRNMLRFSRKSTQNFKNINIVDLLNNTLKLAVNDYDLKENYDFKKIKINKLYENNLPIIPGFESELQQVFFNILKNGAQAIFNNGNIEKPEISISVSMINQLIQIEIFNNGPAIPEEIRKRIFEPFFTTKKVGKGTGLGLSVSYYIITENHKGEMSVESGMNQGVKFIIKLPIKQDSNI